jgi:hypothetical protein
MKKTLIITLVGGFLVVGLKVNLFSIIPGFYGARSLSLGYASSALNYDVNAIFLNAANLSTVPFPISGYQYQHSYMDYKNFVDDFNEVLGFDLKNFSGFNSTDRADVFRKLDRLFHARNGMYGARGNIPGYVSRNFGISVSLVDTAVVNPVVSDIFNKDVESVTNEDIASLELNFIGLRYKQFSIAYSLDLTRLIRFGISLHYLNGKVTEFNSPIVDDTFEKDWSTHSYLEFGWESAEEKFSKLIADFSVITDIGRYFRVGLVYKNVGSPTIKVAEKEIVLNKRLIAAIAYRPNPQWGIYLDVDVAKSELLYNGEEMQPLSIGVEKGFFNNTFFLRAGLLNDLTEKKFFGKESAVLYGLGLGFNMNRIIVDIALGLDSSGTLKNLAISGFFIIK